MFGQSFLATVLVCQRQLSACQKNLQIFHWVEQNDQYNIVRYISVTLVPAPYKTKGTPYRVYQLPVPINTPELKALGKKEQIYKGYRRTFGMNRKGSV